MSALVDSHLSLQRASEALEFPLALVYDSAHDPSALVSILVDSGLPPNRGVLPLDQVGELTTSPLQAAVVAADVARPGALAAARTLRRETPRAGIVVVARDDNRVAARMALNAGADAFVFEQDAADVLAAALRAVVAGMVCVPRVAKRLVAKPSFSHREKQVLELVVAGMTNGQIAEQLFLAESTVKCHLASAFAKLSVCSRKDAAAILLDPDEGLRDVVLPSAALAVGASVRSPTVLETRRRGRSRSRGPHRDAD